MKLERQQQRVEELCGASIRALTGQADLHFRGRRLHKGLKLLPLHAPHLRTDPATDDFASYRGVADGISLRLQLSDQHLFNRYLPQQKVQRYVYEILEQLRVESIVPERFPGMKHNLMHRFETWCLAFHQARLTETHVGLLLYTLSQVVWARLNGRAVLQQTEDLMEATRFHLMPMIGSSVSALRRHRFDQHQYALHALKIAASIHHLIDSETIQQLDANEAGDDETDEIARLAKFINLDSAEETDSVAVGISGESRAFAERGGQYRVFTRQYDRTLEAAAQVRPQLLQELREKLDRLVRGQGVNIPRLARSLMILLSTPRREGWSFAEEEGYIDARRLSQLVASLTETRLYRQQQYLPVANSQLSILIDCSGSMTASIEYVAVLVDILTRALEQAGVVTEVLGYTTGAWNGGKCQQDWMAAGRPAAPGRLNEICNLVYKEADTTWRRARRAISALLKPDLFREGIDGEAVAWACQRLSEGDEPRKLLIVISDGCPMDTATNLANDKFYLDNHLKQVVAEQTRRRGIEIYGLGVGLDLSPFYEHSLALDLAHNLGNQVFDEILQLIAGRHHR